jgi:hypothetical protein
MCNGGYSHQHAPQDKRERFNTITEFGVEGLRHEQAEVTPVT